MKRLRGLWKKGKQGDCIVSEADKLFKSLFQYARERRDEGVYDFTEILSGFYRDVLSPNYSSDNSSRSNLAKRFMNLIKEYVATDPRYQSRLDEFA